MDAVTQRRLPHIYPQGTWLFVTWHLHGSLPPGRFPVPLKASAGQAFVYMDRYLDTTRNGPHHLRVPALAELVVRALESQTGFDLGPYVVMSNHVHALIRPVEAPGRVLQWMKGSTAREANLLLGRTGKPFWQRESYDHWVRDDAEYERICRYIEQNPVKAGLVVASEDYPWSSAWKGRGARFTVPA